MTVPPELVDKFARATGRYNRNAIAERIAREGLAAIWPDVESRIATAVQAERERIAEYVRTNPCEA